MDLVVLRSKVWGRMQPCDRQHAGILPGNFPAECATVTRVRDPCSLLYSKNKNDFKKFTTTWLILDSFPPSFKNKRQMLMLVQDLRKTQRT